MQRQSKQPQRIGAKYSALKNQRKTTTVKKHIKPLKTLQKRSISTTTPSTFLPLGSFNNNKSFQQPLFTQSSSFTSIKTKKQSTTTLSHDSILQECDQLMDLFTKAYPKHPQHSTLKRFFSTLPTDAPPTQQQQQPPPLPPQVQTKIEQAAEATVKATETSDTAEATPSISDTQPIKSTTTGADEAANAATTGTDAKGPQYSHFKRAMPKAKQMYTPTESYFDENGDECLVIYQADDATIQMQLRERVRSLANALIVGPTVVACSLYSIPSPYSYIMVFLAAMFMIVNGGRVYGLHAFVTKITAVWPEQQGDITTKMGSNLNEALIGLTPLPGEEPDNSEAIYENEFTQRQKHNKKIAEERQQKYNLHLKKMGLDNANGENNADNTEAQPAENADEATTKATAQGDADNNNNTATDGGNTTTDQAKTTPKEESPPIPTFPQPGVDPMGRVFSFNLNAPDTLTWKFGWSDMTRRACKEDRQAGTYPLYARASFADQVRAWSSLPDPDFPEYLYIDRLNDGKTPLYQKVPLSDVAAVWSIPIVPPQLPQVTPKLIDQAQTRPHDQLVLMVRAQNTVTGLFPKFMKHDVAMNQLIFGANINARNESKDKFEGIRGRLKI